MCHRHVSPGYLFVKLTVYVIFANNAFANVNSLALWVRSCNIRWAGRTPRLKGRRMLRRSRSPRMRWPSAVGDDDLGPFPQPRKGEGTARQSASLNAPWSKGRTLALTGGEVRVRIPAGQPRIDGTGAVGSSASPEPQPGIEPRAMIANLNIARRADPFNSKGIGGEHSLR